MGEMKVMGREGDTKIIWDSDNDAECDNAEAQFDRLVNEEGFLAFEVTKTGRKDKNKQVRKFDPGMGKLILIPPAQGG
jgi:hypothetical protein